MLTLLLCLAVAPMPKDNPEQAIRKLLDMGYDRGIIPYKAAVDFVG